MNRKAATHNYGFDLSAFIYGMGGTLNITGDYFHRVHQVKISSDDSKSILNDWQAIGGDINKAIRKAEKESAK